MTWEVLLSPVKLISVRKPH